MKRINMKTFGCIIIDDDRYAIQGLAAYISSVPQLNLIKSYENPLEALVDIQHYPPVDLILLDIHMPQLSGIQLSREIRTKTRKLIFTTSYTHYGYDAFQVEADGYLLKPYSLPKFASTVLKVLSSLSQDMDTESKEDYVFVKSKFDNLRLVKINFADIVAIEGQQNYIRIHTATQKIVTYMSLSEMKEILSQRSDFVQFQRSFLIAKSHINSISGNTIRMDNGLEFVVGDKFRDEFHEFIQKKSLRTGE